MEQQIKAFEELFALISQKLTQDEMQLLGDASAILARVATELGPEASALFARMGATDPMERALHIRRVLQDMASSNPEPSTYN